jgi:hypothetical protein
MTPLVENTLLFGTPQLMCPRSRRIGPLLLSVLAAVAALLGAVSSSSAQQPPPGFTLKNENATFILSGVPNAPTNLPASAELTIGGQGNPNQAFQTWWWFRLPTDTRENAINAANPNWTINQAGNDATATFTLAQNLTATMEWTLFGLGNSSAMLTGFLTVKNDTPANVTLALFHYLDLDLGGTKGDDSSNAIQNSEILVGDANWVADYKAIATGFTAFDSNAFPSVRDLLTNNAKDDFPNTEKFFGPGDWTGGFEWMRTVNANGGTAGVTFNLQIGPRPAPAPTSLGLLVVGLVGLFLARRRTGSLGQR